VSATRDDWETFIDLFSQEEFITELPPEPAPVPTCYEDMEDPYRDPGYCDWPKTRVFALPRTPHNQALAELRFRELQEQHGWVTVGPPFYTARHWCWRIAIE
jgi:hypothetical protein